MTSSGGRGRDDMAMTSLLHPLPRRGHEVARCSAPPPRSGHDPARHCQAEGMELLQESRAYVAVTGRSRAGPTRFLDDMLVLKRIGEGQGRATFRPW